MCCSLKQEALPSTLLHHVVAGIACSADGHRGEVRHQSPHASKAALQQPGAPLLLGRRTFLSNPRMLPMIKAAREEDAKSGAPACGVSCQAQEGCLFYCTLKEQSLEPPWKICVCSQCWGWGQEDLVWERRGATMHPHLLSMRRPGHCGAEAWHGAQGCCETREALTGAVTTAHLKIARGRPTSSPFCLVTRSKYPPCSS